MKKIIFFLSAFTIGMSLNLNAQTVNAKAVAEIIEFKDIDHDFGKIPYGKAAEYELEMKNISKAPVKIENVQVGCGCTTPKWEPGPYAPGETFKVGIGFNGATNGVFQKTVTIFFNDGLSQVVKFHGETYKTPDDAAPANAGLKKLKSEPVK